MREKLIELLNASFEAQYSKRGLLTAPHTADDLIANGVTVTDNNVGGKTNGDRIRAMSDEELAAFLDTWGCCHYCKENQRLSDNRWFSDERCDEKCVDHCLEWLQQPAEGE